MRNFKKEISIGPTKRAHLKCEILTTLSSKHLSRDEKVSALKRLIELYRLSTVTKVEPYPVEEAKSLDKVQVSGLGSLGAPVAYHLSKMDVDVTVVEPRKDFSRSYFLIMGPEAVQSLRTFVGTEFIQKCIEAGAGMVNGPDGNLAFLVQPSVLQTVSYQEMSKRHNVKFVPDVEGVTDTSTLVVDATGTKGVDDDYLRFDTTTYGYSVVYQSSPKAGSLEYDQLCSQLEGTVEEDKLRAWAVENKFSPEQVDHMWATLRKNPSRLYSNSNGQFKQHIVLKKNNDKFLIYVIGDCPKTTEVSEAEIFRGTPFETLHRNWEYEPFYKEGPHVFKATPGIDLDSAQEKKVKIGDRVSVPHPLETSGETAFEALKHLGEFFRGRNIDEYRDKSMMHYLRNLVLHYTHAEKLSF